MYGDAFQSSRKKSRCRYPRRRYYSRERDVGADAAVILGFAVVYAFAAYILTGRIRRRFPPGETGFWVMTLAMAVGISLVGVAVGSLLVHRHRGYPVEQRSPELQDGPASITTALGHAVCRWLRCLRVGGTVPFSGWCARQQQAVALGGSSNRRSTRFGDPVSIVSVLFASSQHLQARKWAGPVNRFPFSRLSSILLSHYC